MKIKGTRRVWAALAIPAALLWTSFAGAVVPDYVIVRSAENLTPGASDLLIPVFVKNDLQLRGIVLPLAIRSETSTPANDAFISAIKGFWGDRLPDGGPISAVKFVNHYAAENGNCKQNQPGGFGTITNTGPNTEFPVTVSPYGLMFTRNRIVEAALAPGEDVTGSFLIYVDLNNNEGCFWIDSTCMNPANHLLYALQPTGSGAPVFQGGVFHVGACQSQALASPAQESLTPPHDTRGRDTVTFSWEAVAETDTYEFRIDTVDETFTHIWVQKTLLEPEITLALPRGEMPVFWQVRSVPPSCQYCFGPWTSPAKYTDVTDITTSAGVPDDYILDQNFPNPFNASTVIKFTNKRDGHVKLDVFNILGQNVVTLVDEFKPLGVYAIDWDGTDAAGQPVPSGMYFYRVTADGFNSVKKMVLLK